MKWIFRKPYVNLTALRKVFTAVFLSLLFPLVLLSLIYTRMNDKIRAQFYDRSLTSMQSSLRAMELVFDNIDQIAVYLSDNYDIINYYNLDRSDAVKKPTSFLRAQQVLGSIGVANNDILNIQLYAARSETLLDFSTISLYPERYYGSSFRLDDYDYDQFLGNYLLGTDTLGCSRKIVSGARFHNPEPTLIYEIRHIGSSIRSRSNRALFYLSESRLLELFSSLDSFENASFFLFDEAGNILLLHGEEVFADDAFVRELCELPDTNGPSGYCQVSSNGADASVTFCKSAARGWKCVQAIPYSYVLSATSSFRTSMVLLLAVALITGLLLLTLYGMRLASPTLELVNVLNINGGASDSAQIVERVRELAQNNELLREQISRQVSAIKAETFIRMLTGEDTDGAQGLDMLESLGIRRNAALYMILLINANDIRIDTDLERIGTQRVLLEKLLADQHELEISEIFSVDMERCVLCVTADALSLKEFQRRAENMISRVRKSLGVGGDISYSVGGDIVNAPGRLPKAFLHAQLALKVPQNIFGTHVIQWYERAKQFADLGAVGTAAADDTVSVQNRILIENIQKYIRENYGNPQLSLSLVGEEFYITEVYLSKLFKKATGENFSHYVEGVRMTHAKELLDQGCKVSEVIRQTGYNSPQVFRRAWKRYYGEEEASSGADRETRAGISKQLQEQ